MNKFRETIAVTAASALLFVGCSENPKTEEQKAREKQEVLDKVTGRAAEDYKNAGSPAVKFFLMYLDPDSYAEGIKRYKVGDDCLNETAYDTSDEQAVPLLVSENTLKIHPSGFQAPILTFYGLSAESSQLTPADEVTQNVLDGFGCETGAREVEK